MKVDAAAVSQKQERDSSVAGLTELSDSPPVDRLHLRLPLCVGCGANMGDAIHVTTYPQTSFLTVFGSVRPCPAVGAGAGVLHGRPASPGEPGRVRERVGSG